MKFNKLALAVAMSAATSLAVAGTDNLDRTVTLEFLGTYAASVFDEGAAEIVAHDPETQQLFVINANDASVDVLDIHDPSQPTKTGHIDAKTIGASANSVAVDRGIVAVAIEAADKQSNGSVAFYRASDLALLKVVPVGALPDMVTFSPNGQFVLVANEGEPNDDYDVDPEGSVSVIDLRRGVAEASVATADFRAYIGKEDELRAQGVRIFGPNANAAQDFEPEYIAMSGDSRTAWVTLQENNALAVVDVMHAKVREILPLGYKDHTLPGNELDASDRDDAINIANWPLLGMYLPDSIASYQGIGGTFLVTANEGDSRSYDGFDEEARVKDLDLDPTAFPDADTLQENENIGRLKVTSTLGDSDGDGDYDALYAFGARSFSIWDPTGHLVYDSGADIERITAEHLPDDFNSNNDENDSFDSRSDDKGPEPEGVTVGKIAGRSYAFVGLERVGGILVADVTDPTRVKFEDYVNHRDFTVADVEDDITSGTNQTGDLGPEGLYFIPAHASPIGQPLLVVGNEVSGTTTLYRVNISKAPY